MNRALPNALAEIPAGLLDSMPVNEKDRHVLALAVHVGAPTIVTDNLVDFPADLLEPFGIEAVSTDVFGVAQVDLHGEAVISSIDAISARRRRPPKTRNEIVTALAKQLPMTAEALRRRLDEGPT